MSLATVVKGGGRTGSDGTVEALDGDPLGSAATGAEPLELGGVGFSLGVLLERDGGAMVEEEGSERQATHASTWALNIQTTTARIRQG